MIPPHRPAPARSPPPPPPVATPLPPARANRVSSSLGRPSPPAANPRCSYGRPRSARNGRAHGRRAGGLADRRRQGGPVPRLGEAPGPGPRPGAGRVAQETAGGGARRGGAGPVGVWPPSFRRAPPRHKGAAPPGWAGPEGRGPRGVPGGAEVRQWGAGGHHPRQSAAGGCHGAEVERVGAEGKGQWRAGLWWQRRRARCAGGPPGPACGSLRGGRGAHPRPAFRFPGSHASRCRWGRVPLGAGAG